LVARRALRERLAWRGVGKVGTLCAILDAFVRLGCEGNLAVLGEAAREGAHEAGCRGDRREFERAGRVNERRPAPPTVSVGFWQDCEPVRVV